MDWKLRNRKTIRTPAGSNMDRRGPILYIVVSSLIPIDPILGIGLLPLLRVGLRGWGCCELLVRASSMEIDGDRIVWRFAYFSMRILFIIRLRDKFAYTVGLRMYFWLIYGVVFKHMNTREALV